MMRNGVRRALPLALLLLLSLSTCAPEEKQEILPVVNRDYLPTALALIGRAEKTIDFIQLEFHYDSAVKQIQNALRDALARGVAVRGLIEDHIDFNVKSVEYLKRFGIYAKLDTPEKMTHNKLFIVDGKAVLLGSTNLSWNSMERNNETNVLIRDPAVGRFFEDYFEKLWANSFQEPDMKPSDFGGVRVIFNRYFFRETVSLFENAKGSIRILLYGMSYSSRRPESQASRLVDALIAAAKRGVDVRVLLDKSDYNEIINKVNARSKEHLEAGGVRVRYDDEHVTSHAKLIWVDGVVVIGSYNWGYDALEKRNESAVVVRDPSISDFFLRYFDTLWEGKPWKPGGEKETKTAKGREGEGGSE